MKFLNMFLRFQVSNCKITHDKTRTYITPEYVKKHFIQNVFNRIDVIEISDLFLSTPHTFFYQYRCINVNINSQ